MPEDEVTKVLRNVGILPHDTNLHSSENLKFRNDVTISYFRMLQELEVC
jgi:hypothetical protein